MKKAILMAAFMLSTVSFANETKREGILPKNEKITDAVTHENLEESLDFCFTEVYVHYREIEEEEEVGFGLASVMIARVEIYVSGACEICKNDEEVTSVTCWGSRFPPLWWYF